MRIQILYASQKHTGRSNKDTNGGFGTVNDFGKSTFSSFLKHLKSRTMNFPEILPAYVSAILKSQNHEVTYAENQVDAQADLILILTSIIDFSREIYFASKIKKENSKVKVGFFGGMSAANPALYAENADFVVTGEIENALMNNHIGDFKGIIDGGFMSDLDQLPYPDWENVRKWKTQYGLFHRKKGRVLPILSSRGCPMSCSYYCTYPLVQGHKYRWRSAENVIAEIQFLQERYSISTLIFRDPIFTLRMERIEELCSLIIGNNIHIYWLCETHPRYLTQELIKLMKKAGCVSIKLGIESGNLQVMNHSYRNSFDLDNQRQILRTCEENGISVLGFFILGYFDDHLESLQQTLEYAINLNPLGAQFSIATPYPGTPWYSTLVKENYNLDPIYENYTQYNLVYNHPKLTAKELENWKNKAYRKFYFRWTYFKKHYRSFLKS
jgi:anaerobic magnesium-protoporphyrin IX monomethyl ester cyclase